MNIINFFFSNKKNNSLNENKKIKIFDNKNTKFEVTLKQYKFVKNILKEYKDRFKIDYNLNSNYKLGLYCIIFEKNKKAYLKRILLNDYDNLYDLYNNIKFNNLKLKFLIEKIKININQKDYLISDINSYNTKNRNSHKIVRKGIIKLGKENNKELKEFEITLTNDLFIYNKKSKKEKISQIPWIFIKNIEKINKKRFKIKLDNINIFIIELSNFEEREIWVKALIFAIDICKESNYLNEIQQDIMKDRQKKMCYFRYIIEIPSRSLKENKLVYETKILEYKNKLNLVYKIWLENYNSIFKIDNANFVEKLYNLLLNLSDVDIKNDDVILNFTDLINEYSFFKDEIQFKNKEFDLNNIITKLNVYLELKTKFNDDFLNNYFNILKEEEINKFN